MPLARRRASASRRADAPLPPASTVKRHQRGRHAGNPDDVGAPSILGHGGHLDQIGPSCDGFFEAMDSRVTVVGQMVVRLLGARSILRFEARAIKRSGSRKRMHSARSRSDFTTRARRKKISLVVSVHRKFTNHPQVFHSLDLASRAHTTLATSCPAVGWRPRSPRSRWCFPAARRAPGARRCHAAARFPERRHVARQLRRAGAGRRSRDFLDADGDDAESAAASRQPAARSRRLGSHQPLRDPPRASHITSRRRPKTTTPRSRIRWRRR